MLTDLMPVLRSHADGYEALYGLMLLPPTGQLRYEAVKNKNIKGPRSLVKLPLTFDRPGRSLRPVQAPADPPGNITLIQMIVCDKVRF